MPLPSNFNAILGASVLGIVCAATVYLVEQYRQERRRHSMAQDLARLDTELNVLRKQFDQLLAQQQRQKDKTAKVKKMRLITSDKRLNSMTSTTTDDYVSATDIDSDDLEFYDVSDNEEVDNDFDKILEEIDDDLDNGTVDALQKSLTKLQDLQKSSPNNPQIQWRIGKAYYKLYEKTDDKDLQRAYINQGIEACQLAVDQPPKLVHVHKWLAILIGSRSEFQPIKDKILDGHLFKKHVDIAIDLDPNDSTLHHMLGRFCYEIASLKWYERKIASTLYAEPPNCTFNDALERFLKAEQLSGDRQWKENKLCIGKCKIQMGEIEDGIQWLLDAQRIDNDVVNDDYNQKLTNEIQTLLAKYNNSR